MSWLKKMIIRWFSLATKDYVDDGISKDWQHTFKELEKLKARLSQLEKAKPKANVLPKSEQRLKTLQGKYNAEVGRLKKENDHLKQRIANLKKQVESV